MKLLRAPRRGVDADVWIEPRAAGTNAHAARRWSAGTHVSFARDEVANVSLFVHELGHYFFDLFDEYAGPAVLGLRCGNCLMSWPDAAVASGWFKLVLRDPRDPAREIRQLYGTLDELLAGVFGERAPRHGFLVGSAREFCRAVPEPGTTVHDAAAPSFQNERHASSAGGLSCWEVMTRPGTFAHERLGLEPPPPGSAAPAPAPAPPHVFDLAALARAPAHAAPRARAGEPERSPRVRAVRPSRSVPCR